MSATLKCTITNGLGEFQFPIANRKLVNQLEDIVRILQDKSEQPFDHLSLILEKNQCSSSQIGQILHSLRSKTQLISLHIKIGDSNKVDNLFSKRLSEMLLRNKQTLQKVSVQMGRSCSFGSSMFNIVAALKECSRLQIFDIKIGQKNNTSFSQLESNFGLIKFSEFSLSLKAESNQIIEGLNNWLRNCKDNFTDLQICKVQIVINQYSIQSLPKVDLFFCNGIKLKQISLKGSTKTFIVSKFLQTSQINNVNLQISDIDSSENLLGVISSITELSKLQQLQISFPSSKIDYEQLQIQLSTIIQRNRQSLKHVSLTIQIETVIDQVISGLLKFPIQKLSVELHLTRQRIPYIELFRACHIILDNQLPSEVAFTLQSKEIMLKVDIKDKIYELKANESFDLSAVHNKQFKEVDQIIALSLKLQQKSFRYNKFFFQPCLASNYSRYKLELYQRLFEVDTRQLKVSIASEFQLGYGSLLINIDCQEQQMLYVIFSLIHQSPIRRLIVYHSQVSVLEVYEAILQLFLLKPFLVFDNYFMYSETRKPHYKVIKHCQTQAKWNEKILMQLKVVRDRLQKFGLLDIQVQDIVENISLPPEMR